MSDPVRALPSGGPGCWRRWLLPVLASAAWLVLTLGLYRHAIRGEQAHLLELCHTRLAATAHQLMDARDWNAGHGGVYVPLSAYGEPNPWLPEKDRTLQTADGRTLVLMNPAYMSRQMAERLTEPGFRLAIVGQAPLRPGNRADDWERRILATATRGGQVFFSGEDCLPQGRLRLLRTLAAQESCLRCHQGHREGDVRVRSCPGQGCTFTLEARLEMAAGGPGPRSGAPCPPKGDTTAPAAAAGPLRGLRVLVADDDAAGRYLLEVRLRERGCTVGLAADGEQVLDMLASAPWDVILLDAGMPRMDGLTVLERIRAGQSAAPRRQAVIVHSAGLAPGEEARFRSLGVRALLDKPVPPAMLLAALRDVSRGCPGGGRQEPLLPCGAEEDAPVIWDRAAALAAADQDGELLRTLVTALRDDLPRLEGDLAAARKMAADPAVPAAQTAEALRRAAHALKNSAATLCLGELRLRAAALEQAARRVLAGTPDNAEGLEPLAAACAAALARAGDALRREKE